MKHEIKIPTLFAIFLIIFVLGGVSLVTNYTVQQDTKAAINLTPQHVAVTSVTDAGFTVTWETDQPSLSAVTISGPDKIKQTFFDERHGIGDSKKYTTTSIPVRGLQPETEYKIELSINGKSYTSPELSVVKTSPKLTTDTNGMSPVYGSVMTKENKPAEGALVFLTLGDNSQMVSTVVKPSGSWIIPLNLLRTKDGKSLVKKSDDRQQISVIIKYAGLETTILTDTMNATPIPSVVVGGTYDFRGQQAKKKSESQQKNIASSFSSVLGAETSQPAIATDIQLINPAQGAHIPGDIPLFSGKGIPGNIVTLIMGLTNPKVETTRIQSDGTWQLSPKKPLGIGPQRVTMTTLDQKKTAVAITHSFEIMKSGTQVLGIATPSATIAVTPTNTPVPTTAVVSPTIIPTAIPTEIITPTPVIPTTGNILQTNVLLVAGCVLLLTGIVVIAL